MKLNNWSLLALIGLVVSSAMVTSCSTEKRKNEAKEAAARYWQDKAYPGKAYDVQVIEAEKADDGKFRVKGIVDGETRVGLFNPDTETFSEGYYSMAHEKTKRVAELEQEVRYWKERSENQDKEIYKLKVRLNLAQGKKPPVEDEEESEATEAPATQPTPAASATKTK